MKTTKVYQQALLLLLLCLFAGLPANAQDPVDLKFNENKTFKIAQFTDIHWDNNSKNCPETIETIEYVLETEEPDLAILTGDIVTTIPAVEGWKAVSEPFVKAGIPWTVTLGNHDAEPSISRDEIFELLQTIPFFIGKKGPELSGCGNYTINIKSPDGKKTLAIIYCFDSNSYSINKKISDYDWIHFDQIDWYRNASKKATALNNNRPLPSLAFFHIPLPEFNQIVGKETTKGIQDEGVASPKINSGLFTSMLEMKDIMGVFVGHDHANNYIGIHKDIALAFGQVTGADAYGNFDRGSRIIQMKEGEYAFDSWIRTKNGVEFNYNYPSGLLYDDSNVEYSPSSLVGELTQGVAFNYFEGEFSSTKEIEGSKIIKSGILDNISLKPADVKDYYSFEFNAFMKISKKGVYRFYTYSDDGSVLYIDDKLVVDNEGSHSARREDGSIALEEGYHKFRLVYFESYMGNELEVGISGLSIRESQIPDDMLFIAK